MYRIGAVLAFLLVCLPMIAARAEDKAGQFDYYALVLSWSPTFCEGNSDEGPQCNGKRPYAFTVVRNPYSRVLSCYLDKIATPKRKFREHLDLDDRNLSLIDFLHRLNDGYLRADPHWAPQSELAPFPWLDFVGRVESLNQDLNAVLAKVFHNAALPVVTKTTGQTNSQSKLNEYCGRAERALIARLYARDFEQFYPDAV